jgi:hypothetical protein
MSVRMQLDTPRRWSDAGRGFVALVGVVVLAVGVPAALVSWVGWPLPTEVPTLSQVSAALRDTYIPDEFLVKALAVVCWLVWIELMASLLVEAVAYVRGRKAGAVPLAGGLQRGAARLVATVALLGALLATKGMPGSGGHPPRPLAPTTQAVVTLVVDEPPEGRAADAGAAVDARRAPAPTYEVQRRDTLWDIAERHLGDPFRWQEIFRLNQGRVQPDGRCLTDPDLIYAGWRLELPEDAGGLTPPAAARAPAPPDRQPPAPPAGSDGMVLLDDGRDGDAVAVTDQASPAADGAGGMVLLPDAGVWGGPPIQPPQPPQPRDDQIAARDQ